LSCLTHWRRPQAGGSVRLLGLVPVYNREDLLVQCLQALRRSVDGIIALDDGSTDETPLILRGESKVFEIITKPPKSLAQWNDANNRYLLYQAAHNYNPEWLLCVDADEILEPTFAVYREQLMNQPSCIQGYAFPLVAIYNNKITGPLLVDRMYRFKPGYRFDPRRLHCRLMPLDITDEEIRTTNIRFFHYSASPEQKRARYEKYLIADANREFQASYENLLRTNPSQPILPIGGGLQLRPFIDDTVAVKELFPPVEEGSAMFEEHLLQLQAQLVDLVGVMTELHQSRLDFFLVEECLENGNFRVSHRFDAGRSLELSPRLAWLVEKYRIRKDFFFLAAGFATFFAVAPGDYLAELRTVLGALEELGVLI